MQLHLMDAVIDVKPQTHAREFNGVQSPLRNARRRNELLHVLARQWRDGSALTVGCGASEGPPSLP
jgi:hypothetical protein